VTRAPILALAALLSLGFGDRAAPESAAEAAPSHDDEPRATGPSDVGPRSAEPPKDAAIAQDEATLTRWLADPKGPEEIWLRGRTYHGHFVVRRSVVLRGATGATLDGDRRGTVLEVEADDVVLQDLAIRGSGRSHTAEDAAIHAKGRRVRVDHVRVDDALFGVSFGMCQSCSVEHTHVTGDDDLAELRGDGIKIWESHDAVVRDCLVERARDVVVWYSRRALVEDVVVRGGRYGAHFMYSHDAVVRRSHFERNVVGIFVMYSARMELSQNVLAGASGPAGMGLGFKDSDAIRASGNWLVANTTGIYLDRTPRSPADPVEITGNVLALNDVGVRFHSSPDGDHFIGNELRQNASVVEVDRGADAMAATFRDNAWSDYAGYDLDRDGHGDVPFELRRLSAEITSEHPPVRLFEGTAALGLVDAVAHAVPLLASRPVLVDPSPLMTPPRIPLP
jgi:nitrous oxidase accessory protein